MTEEAKDKLHIASMDENSPEYAEAVEQMGTLMVIFDAIQHSYMESGRMNVFLNAIFTKYAGVLASVKPDYQQLVHDKCWKSAQAIREDLMKELVASGGTQSDAIN